MSLIKPFLQGEAFLQDVQNATGSERVLHIWWLGQSGFLLKWQSSFLLFDPYLSDSLTRKYAATDKPHVRMTERVVAPERLSFVDVVTSSHNHTDHLDGETLGPLKAANPDLQFVIPEANRAFVAGRLACGRDWPVGLDDGDFRDAGVFRFHGIAAAHEELERDEAGRCRFLGYVTSFGPWTVYHSGDTVHYSGLVEKLTPFNVDIAILPVNGSKPERRVAGNLNGIEAATLACAINAKLVIPCHYEMFTFNTASPDTFRAAADALEQPVRVLQAGERCTVEKSAVGAMTVLSGD
ncbi:MAG: MBL fold metallo-hydrolase [Caldilineaceae bacterium SB0661_bin_32]|uniref:MBL fold metallo-hydrolase n=1 Tax=Caldilineaceae bacterium SB0661_bin_32 TaxID=2605255 RepID=A0A6B1DAC7_9CHLR|nr:MBL fold metallo-hydrolase [Caldilineaceae bacterium SB0661_bin_32]